MCQWMSAYLAYPVPGLHNLAAMGNKHWRHGYCLSCHCSCCCCCLLPASGGAGSNSPSGIDWQKHDCVDSKAWPDRLLVRARAASDGHQRLPHSHQISLCSRHFLTSVCLSLVQVLTFFALCSQTENCYIQRKCTGDVWWYACQCFMHALGTIFVFYLLFVGCKMYTIGLRLLR